MVRKNPAKQAEEMIKSGSGDQGKQIVFQQRKWNILIKDAKDAKMLRDMNSEKCPQAVTT